LLESTTVKESLTFQIERKREVKRRTLFYRTEMILGNRLPGQTASEVELAKEDLEPQKELAPSPEELQQTRSKPPLPKQQQAVRPHRKSTVTLVVITAGVLIIVFELLAHWLHVKLMKIVR